MKDFGAMNIQNLPTCPSNADHGDLMVQENDKYHLIWEFAHVWYNDR
jgi:hypothetical protein